jgi:hypothetical protein
MLNFHLDLLKTTRLCLIRVFTYEVPSVDEGDKTLPEKELKKTFFNTIF